MDSFAIFMIVVVLAAGAVGWSKGLVRQLSQVAAVILGIIAARIFGPAVRDMLGGDSILRSFMAYVIVFGGVYVVVWLGSNLLKDAVRALHLGAIDKAAGMVFNVFKWILIVSLIVNIYEVVMPGDEFADSKVYRATVDFGPDLLGTDAVIQLRNKLQ